MLKFGGIIMIITVTLNPAQDKSVVIDNFGFDKVNRITEMRLDAGGKGINVSKVVKSLGGETLALGVLGGTIGGYIMHSMDEMNIRHDFVHVASETRTNLKIYDPTTKMYTDINEPGFELPAERLDEVETKLFYYAKPGDYVVFAGGAPSGVPNDTLYKWTKKLKARNVSVIADLDGELLKNTVAARPFMIKPNLAELMRLCGLRDTSIYTLVDVAKKLVAEGIRTVVVCEIPARGGNKHRRRGRRYDSRVSLFAFLQSPLARRNSTCHGYGYGEGYVRGQHTSSA